jgi:hypothetical protein
MNQDSEHGDQIRPLGDCFLWAVLLITNVSQILELLFFTGKSYVCISFDNKWIGQPFGRYFPKLVWSP